MSDLFDDLQDGSSRDYFFGLDSAPGGISPNSLTLTISGLAPTIFEQTSVFRTPNPAVLTINALPFTPDFILRPAAAALSLAGQAPDEFRSLIISPALPDLDYSEPVSNAPTILFINTITPTTGQVTLGSLELNVTPGGNIAFVEPAAGSVRMTALTPTLIFHPVEIGLLSVGGHAPTLQTELILGAPDNESEEAGIPTGALSIVGLAPTLERPFGWIDVDPPPATIWTTTTGVAA